MEACLQLFRIRRRTIDVLATWNLRWKRTNKSNIYSLAGLRKKFRMRKHGIVTETRVCDNLIERYTIVGDIYEVRVEKLNSIRHL